MGGSSRDLIVSRIGSGHSAGEHAGAIADYARVLAALWDPPAETVREFSRLTTKAALADDCAARYFVGYLAGHPVAAGEVFFGGGIAGIYNIATQVQFRCRGIGGAMTTAALNAAMDEGYPWHVFTRVPGEASA